MGPFGTAGELDLLGLRGIPPRRLRIGLRGRAASGRAGAIAPPRTPSTRPPAGTEELPAGS